MPRELKNATITHVSYVDKAANKKKFFLTKSAEESAPTFTMDVRLITKADDAERLVYGVVYEPGVEDTHGDFMTALEIEKAAHAFLKDARNIDTQHDFVAGVGDVVESYIAPADFTIGEETITKGTWVMVTKATEEVWEQIQKGEITGYSMAGTAEVEEKDTVEKSFFKMVKDFFTKGEVADTFHANRQRRDMWSAFYIFEDIVYDESWKETPDVQRIKEAANDFGQLLVDLANSTDVLKSLGTPIKKEETQVDAEQLKAILKEALEPVEQRLASLEKEEAQAAEGEEGQAEGEEVAKAEDNTAELIKAAITEAVAPLSGRIEKMENARAQATNLKAENVQKAAGESADNVWGSLFQV